MSSVQIQGNAAGAGVFTVASPNSASSYTATLPTQTGTLGMDGPAFSAYASATQSITSNVSTKVAIDTENFDTNSCYDTTNYRFTPTVAGYYQVNGSIRLSANANTITQTVVSILKNGVGVGSSPVDNVATTVVSSYLARNINTLIYMNGSTDYIELYGSITGTSPQFLAGSATATSFFSASLVRGA